MLICVSLLGNCFKLFAGGERGHDDNDRDVSTRALHTRLEVMIHGPFFSAGLCSSSSGKSETDGLGDCLFGLVALTKRCIACNASSICCASGATSSTGPEAGPEARGTAVSRARGLLPQSRQDTVDINKSSNTGLVTMFPAISCKSF